MLTQASSQRYSSTITLNLIEGDRTHALAQIGHNLVITRTPVQLSGGPATVVMTVDGEVRKWEVLIAPMTEPSDFIHHSPAQPT